MKKELKQLIESAEQYNAQLLDELLIIPSGKAYNGFWGKNGYNKIILLGINKRDYKVYRIDTDIQHDVISFDYLKEIGIKIDIPEEYNCVRLFFSHNQFVVSNEASCFIVYVEEIENGRNK